MEISNQQTPHKTPETHPLAASIATIQQQSWKQALEKSVHTPRWTIEKKLVANFRIELDQINNWIEAIEQYMNDPDNNSLSKNNPAFVLIAKFAESITKLETTNSTFRLFMSHNSNWPLWIIVTYLTHIWDQVRNWCLSTADLEFAFGNIKKNIYSFNTAFYSMLHWVDWEDENEINFSLRDHIFNMLEFTVKDKKNRPEEVIIVGSVPNNMNIWKLWTLSNTFANMIRNAKKHWGSTKIQFSFGTEENMTVIRVEDNWIWINTSESDWDTSKIFEAWYSSWGSTWAWLAELPQQLESFWAHITEPTNWNLWWAKFEIHLPISPN